MTPERKARVEVDALLAAEGTHVCDMAQASIHPATGVAIPEFPLDSGVGFAGYLFHLNGCSWGFIEVRKQGAILAGVEPRSDRYVHAVVDGVSVAEFERRLSIICEVEAKVDPNVKRAHALLRSTLANAFSVEGCQI